MRGETSPTCLVTMLWPCLDTMLWPCLATIMALPLCCGPACHYVMAHGAINHSETNISIIESTDKGFPEILSWVIIGLGQNALRSEAFDKFQA